MAIPMVLFVLRGDDENRPNTITQYIILITQYIKRKTIKNKIKVEERRRWNLLRNYWPPSTLDPERQVRVRRWKSRGCLMPPGKEEPMLTNGERECQDVDNDLTVRHARGNRMNPWWWARGKFEYEKNGAFIDIWVVKLESGFAGSEVLRNGIYWRGYKFELRKELFDVGVQKYI